MYSVKVIEQLNHFGFRTWEFSIIYLYGQKIKIPFSLSNGFDLRIYSNKYLTEIDYLAKT